MSCLSRLTCVKSLAPATSTNITLLQSINTAWTSVSDVSADKKKKDFEIICSKKTSKQSNLKNVICRGQMTVVDVLIQNKNIYSF